jgi:hypothetical protein
MNSSAQNLGSRAEGYFNLKVSDTHGSSTSQGTRRIISAEGFPSGMTVTYVDAPKMSYHSVDAPREIKHIVLHSFGHSWHADSSGKGGWFNDPSGGGVDPYIYDKQTIYVARGSDAKTLGHPERLKGSIQAAVGSMSRSTAHFYIDRAGNLLVVGDVNNVMFVADAVNETSVSISLEEAFYLVKDPLEERAIWSTSGVPPGSAGNVKYFSFSGE